jgi:hypothetical protein
MSKILNSFEKITEDEKQNELHHLTDPVDLLTRIKLFLKITRIVVENANKELSLITKAHREVPEYITPIIKIKKKKI